MKYLKKSICITLIVILSLTFVACGKKRNNVSAESTEITETTTEVISETTVSETSTELVTEDIAENQTDDTNISVDKELRIIDEPHEDGSTSLTYIGHASVKLVSKDGIVVYIDSNYKDGDYTDEADIVLVTHSYDDHKPCTSVVYKADATTITWKEAHPSPDVYEKFDIKGIEIEAVPASNMNHNIDMCVGYIITIDGYKIYHAGDTSMLDTMADFAEKEIDFALYPIDGTYNMDAVEATEVANIVNAKYSIPIHENDVGDTRKSDDFQPASRLVLEYGDTIIIGE